MFGWSSLLLQVMLNSFLCCKFSELNSDLATPPLAVLNRRLFCCRGARLAKVRNRQLILHLQAIEQNVLGVGVVFVCQRFNLQPPALGDRARRGGFEVLAKMVRRNVRKRAKLHLEAHDSLRALLAGNRFNLPDQIVYEREFVHNSSFTIRKTSSAATFTSGERPTRESKFLPSIP